jgi:hypothetical protein
MFFVAPEQSVNQPARQGIGTMAIVTMIQGSQRKLLSSDLKPFSHLRHQICSCHLPSVNGLTIKYFGDISSIINVFQSVWSKKV